MGVFIDPADLPESADGFIQILFLLAVYGYILMQASNLISDGSELLLLVPALAGVVGSVVLPVLGAVPDGAIVACSGLGPDAQNQLTVGVGALAGSTIMLLTIPWAMSIIGGRVNIDPHTQEANYKRPHSGLKDWAKLMPPDNRDLWHTGVAISPPVRVGGLIMLATAITYFFIQVPAFVYYNEPSSSLAREESPWALVGLILAVLSFAGYLIYQFRISATDVVKNDRIAEIAVDRIQHQEVTLMGVLGPEFQRMRQEHKIASPGGNYGSLPQTPTPEVSNELRLRVKELVRRFFHKFDDNRNGCIEVGELAAVFIHLGESVSAEELREIFSRYDKDHSGELDIDEFVSVVLDFGYRLHRLHHPSISSRPASMDNLAVVKPGNEEAMMHHHHKGDEEEDEEEEMPEDLKDLDWETQQFRIKLRSFYMMAVGTVLVLIFSDPMVDVLSEVGKRTGIPSFYISFVLSPLVSNASELIASYNYAQKKTSKTITISLATLVGAAILNNTFVLGIFLFLVYFKSLAWEYSAETIAILFVELCMGLLTLQKLHNLAVAGLVLSLYPLSLLMVYFLENVVGLN